MASFSTLLSTHKHKTEMNVSLGEVMGRCPGMDERDCVHACVHACVRVPRIRPSATANAAVLYELGSI